MKYLVLLWGFWFCREVFVFALRFSVLPWHLWATRWLWRNGTRISVGTKQDLFRCSIVLVVPEILSRNDAPKTGHVPFNSNRIFRNLFVNGKQTQSWVICATESKSEDQNQNVSISSDSAYDFFRRLRSSASGKVSIVGVGSRSGRINQWQCTFTRFLIGLFLPLLLSTPAIWFTLDW